MTDIFVMLGSSRPAVDCGWDPPWDDAQDCFVIEIEAGGRSIDIILVGDRTVVVDTLSELAGQLAAIAREARLYS